MKKASLLLLLIFIVFYGYSQANKNISKSNFLNDFFNDFDNEIFYLLTDIVVDSHDNILVNAINFTSSDISFKIESFVLKYNRHGCLVRDCGFPLIVPNLYSPGRNISDNQDGYNLTTDILGASWAFGLTIDDNDNIYIGTTSFENINGSIFIFNTGISRVET
jgi:hypothetical protein